MAKLSIIIPSRDEVFLTKTIDDIFRNARGEIEVIAVLDSDKWLADWADVVARHAPRLHTIHNGAPIGMRGSINKGVGSAKSRGAKYVMKLDGHCMLAEGFDEVIKADLQPNWVMTPRRKRLDADNWTLTDTHKIDIDYHYLSFPDNPSDWGGKGLNGKPWDERSRERRDKPEYEIDDEMASQGSGWAMMTDYFYELELMDETNYGPFWNESQEILLKCWLSGGRGVINKKTWYAHLHKGKTHGRGYKLPESWLQQGATYTKLWMFNEAWPKQTLPFKWLIEKFWPVPTWPENWEEVLYAERKPRAIVGGVRDLSSDNRGSGSDGSGAGTTGKTGTGLVIHQANYGIRNYTGDFIDVTERLQSLVKDNSLDIIINNSTLTPNQNPFRGKKKRLHVVYSIDGVERIERIVEEKDWLIIGPARHRELEEFKKRDAELVSAAMVELGIESAVKLLDDPPRTPAALNDYLIRRFSISPQRLRGPMPIELRDFHRNDLAHLFAELGFKRMVEVGVAEGNYSEVLLKANPEAELILVDPWGDVEGNAQNKGSSRHGFAYEETKRKTAPYPNVRMLKNTSMGVVGGFKDGWFDAVYLDANHSYPFIMEDLINWTRKVRSGGIVALDDIYKLDEARWGAGPMEAIYDYTRAMRINPWWLIAAHKSVDAFFVKP